jgi:hypothetical protein
MLTRFDPGNRYLQVCERGKGVTAIRIRLQQMKRISGIPEYLHQAHEYLVHVLAGQPSRVYYLDPFRCEDRYTILDCGLQTMRW